VLKYRLVRTKTALIQIFTMITNIFIVNKLISIANNNNRMEFAFLS